MVFNKNGIKYVECLTRIHKVWLRIIFNCSATHLFSQSYQHHKEPMFLHLLFSISLMHHFVYTYFISKIHNLFHVCPTYMCDFLIESLLIGPVYGNIFLEFSMTLRKDSEQYV